ncbi:cdc42 effector protein 3 [Astyanax mexicanus]|uniref:cdc42 effector protein 3 n=1 Tax=Astyanax mexicanus TaxID=7994 RepID=UPI000440BD06|nr:cdc42 effector protein 3 [Astyanax mexicanus]
MPAKTPMYLKTSTPKRGKRFKLRDVLSGDMISPPLGDVRHSAHVGPDGQGDMFGDIDFLQGKLDMLPGLARPPHVRSNSMDRHLDGIFDVTPKGISHTYDSHRNSHHTSHLKSTISMPIFIAPEQPPPKPPRLHLEDNCSHEHHQQQQPQQEQQKNHLSQNQQEQQKNHHNQNQHELQRNHHNQNQQEQQKNHHNNQQRSMSVCEEAMGRCKEPCNDLTISASIPILRHLMPSTGSFSEASSDDSMSEGCGPLDPSRGLSLDSDAGLSNEDLRSDRSESPVLSAGVSRSESLVGLDLDLGPSILEDVLRIMDRYKSVEEQCEL